MKKAISEEKVQRMRNIVTGNHDKAVKVQSGYSSNIKRSEGDVWEDRGKTWTIKNGVKQSLSKMQMVRDLVKMPLTCPSCGNVMKGQFDKHHWKIDKKCLGCFAKDQTKLTATGTWEEKR